MTARKRILIIGMADSVHVARWLEIAINDDVLDVLFIPTSPHRSIHPSIKSRMTRDSNFVMHPFLKLMSLPIWVLDRGFGFRDGIRAAFIERAVRTFKPDLIHIMETQNGGYPFSKAYQKLALQRNYLPPSMLTLFGSDLFWYKNFPSHVQRIRTVLQQVQIISAECARDLQLATEFGFTGSFLPLIPVAGGLPTNSIGEPDTLEMLVNRKSIAVKGYGGKWGLGFIAVDVLAKLHEELRGYKIEVFSASASVSRIAKRKFSQAGIQHVIHNKFSLSHSDVLRLYRRSRIYIGLSRSDGLPASLLEAMSQGCFPIQSATACFQGWVEPDTSGTILLDTSHSQVEQAIRKALVNDAFILEAQKSNIQTILKKYSSSTLLRSRDFSYSRIINS